MDKAHEIIKRKILITQSISSALKQMDVIGKKLLLVFDGNDFLTLISIGDIQRAIIKNISLDTKISHVLRKDIDYATVNEPIETVKARMLSGRAELMPIIDESGVLVDVLFWEDLFPKEKIPQNTFDLPIIIMAGGKGTRLQPLTNVIPKPLIPIGSKTIIELIMDHFVEVGSNNFFLSVNYKAQTIKHYFEQLNSEKYQIEYFEEEKPLGTAGSLHLIKDKIESTFFVSNCDIIINDDYSEILKYHRETNNELTIVSAIKHFSIPYGTIQTSQGGILTNLTEKPDINFQINTGMYILEPHLFEDIPQNEFFHITTLIEKIKNRNGKVGVFPISEGSWTDIGEWKEYLKIINK